jgi:Fur family ferric uptake transcriptional regulator
MLQKDHTDIYRQFKVIFEQEGLDRIDERLSILEAFLATENHVTASELTTSLREGGVSLSDDFVIENLRLFSQYGFAQEEAFRGQIYRYEHRHLGVHHDHLICVRCGMILEFYSPQMETLQTAVSNEKGFHALQHRMEIYGLCFRCSRKREPTVPLTMATPGETVRIMEFRGGTGVEGRLRSMGLARGVEVEVIKSSGPGPLIVASGETRIALGFGMAKKILVSMARHKE